MKIEKAYSHLNGLEWLESHRPKLWVEIQETVRSIDASTHQTKRSLERGKKGRHLYSPTALNKTFKKYFLPLGWRDMKVTYAVCSDETVIRRTLLSSMSDQEMNIREAGHEPIPSYNQVDFVKEDVAIEVQFGKYSFIAYDLFVKHMAFFVRGDIKVGIEILPMKSMQAKMSSGPGYFEWALYNIVRQGRGIPAVPLVLLGITP